MVNKLLVIYFINIIAFVTHFTYAVIALISGDVALSILLFLVSFILLLILGLLYFYKTQRLASILITLTAAAVMLYLLFTGGTEGSGHLWILVFPAFAIPLFRISMGNFISFCFFLILIAYFVFQNKLNPGVTYSFPFVLRLLGAYTVIHFLFYLGEYMRNRNFTVLEKKIMDTENESRQKDDFLSKLSHQIRTPLNNITVISNLINKAKLDAEHRDLFDTILASTINLINVVNNIVKVSEVKIEKELSNQVNFDLFSSIDNTLKLFRDQHKDRLEIDFKLKNLKSNYIGDPIRIKQIFLNIIENIIKANPTGKLIIEIDISLDIDNEIETELGFHIKCPQLQIESDDYGNYYSRPDEMLIKEGIYQPDDYLIDFTIAKKIIEYYGGEFIITTTSELTTLAFAFMLKKGTLGTYKADSEKESARLLVPKHKVDIKDANILLVEDNAVNQKIIILSLKNYVKNIDIANNGKDALDKFGKTKYDLILMDIQMPVINGIAATKKIRELESSSNTQTPIIAITANALSGDKESCLAAGMNDYISKPFQIDILVNKMKLLLEV